MLISLSQNILSLSDNLFTQKNTGRFKNLKNAKKITKYGQTFNCAFTHCCRFYEISG